MKIGLVTDTHDKYALIKEAVHILENEKCEYVLHGGDFSSNRSCQMFSHKSFNFKYVTDHKSHDKRLKERRDILKEKIGECRFAMYHNTYHSSGNKKIGQVHDLATCGKYDFVIYGHLHYFNLKLPGPENETVVINSGGFYYENLTTFCILDLEAAKLTTFYLVGKKFFPILRFSVFGQFEDIEILDRESACLFADNLREMRWKFKDRWEFIFSQDSQQWFSKNYDIFFKKLKIKDNPDFFY